MKKLTAKQKSELRGLQHLPDAKIDTSDIPEMNFSGRAVVGKFYRPLKTPISFRIDADVLDWLKRSGPGYQKRMNDILRREMLSGSKHA